MDTVSMFFVSLALSMDAFAASLCLGMSVSKLKMRFLWLAGAYFGAFQAVMPCIGYLLGASFYRFAAAFDHWIAFLLLGGIGIRMIRDALSKKEQAYPEDGFSHRRLAAAGFASAIDALAVGITLAVSREEKILSACAMIGSVTLVLCAWGVWLGHAFGSRFQTKARVAGGAVLFLIGARILLEHLRAAC